MNRLSLKMLTDWFVSLLMNAFFTEMLPFCGFCLGCSQHYLFVEWNRKIGISIKLSVLLQQMCIFPSLCISRRRTKGVCVYFSYN